MQRHLKLVSSNQNPLPAVAELPKLTLVVNGVAEDKRKTGGDSPRPGIWSPKRQDTYPH